MLSGFLTQDPNGGASQRARTAIASWRAFTSSSTGAFDNQPAGRYATFCVRPGGLASKSTASQPMRRGKPDASGSPSSSRTFQPRPSRFTNVRMSTHHQGHGQQGNPYARHIRVPGIGRGVPFRWGNAHERRTVGKRYCGKCARPGRSWRMHLAGRDLRACGAGVRSVG